MKYKEIFIHNGNSVENGNCNHEYKYSTEKALKNDDYDLLLLAKDIYASGIIDFEIWHHHFHCSSEEDLSLFILSFK